MWYNLFTKWPQHEHNIIKRVGRFGFRSAKFEAVELDYTRLVFLEWTLTRSTGTSYPVNESSRYLGQIKPGLSHIIVILYQSYQLAGTYFNENELPQPHIFLKVYNTLNYRNYGSWNFQWAIREMIISWSTSWESMEEI